MSVGQSILAGAVPDRIGCMTHRGGAPADGGRPVPWHAAVLCTPPSGRRFVPAMPDPATLTLLLPNRIEALEHGIKAVEMLLDEWRIGPDDRAQVLVMLDEIGSNVIKAAWPPGEDRSFDVEVRLVRCSPSAVDLSLLTVDDGVPFDPTAAPPPGLDAPLDARDPGGLGLYLVRSMSDSVQDSRVDGCNRLLVTKRLQRTSPS